MRKSFAEIIRNGMAVSNAIIRIISLPLSLIEFVRVVSLFIHQFNL